MPASDDDAAKRRENLKTQHLIMVPLSEKTSLCGPEEWLRQPAALAKQCDTYFEWLKAIRLGHVDWYADSEPRDSVVMLADGFCRQLRYQGRHSSLVTGTASQDQSHAGTP